MPEAANKSEKMIDIVMAVLLALSALGTAWAT